MENEKKENFSPKCDFMRMKRDYFRTEIRKEELKKIIEKKRFNIQTTSQINISSIPKISEYLKNFSNDQKSESLITDIEDFLNRLQKNNEQTIGFLMALRNLTCNSNQNILETMAKSRLIYFFEGLLKIKDSTFCFEIFWILVNITTLSYSKLENIPNFSNLTLKMVTNVDFPKEEIKLKELQIWIFNNLAFENQEIKLKLLESGIIDCIIDLLEEKTTIDLIDIQNGAAQLMCELCKENKMTENHFQMAKNFIPIFSKLISRNNSKTIYYALNSLSYLTKGSNARISECLMRIDIKIIFDFLDEKKPEVFVPAFQIIRNIVSGDDSHTKLMIDHNVLDYFEILLNSEKSKIRREVCFCLSNICAASPLCLEKLIIHNVFNFMLNLGRIDDFNVKKEICYALSNFSIRGQDHQIMNVLGRGILDIWSEVLGFSELETDLIIIILMGIEALLKRGKNMESFLKINVILNYMQNSDIANILISLQHHEHQKVYDFAFKILDTYFGAE